MWLTGAAVPYDPNNFLVGLLVLLDHMVRVPKWGSQC